MSIDPLTPLAIPVLKLSAQRPSSSIGIAVRSGRGVAEKVLKINESSHGNGETPRPLQIRVKKIFLLPYYYFFPPFPGGLAVESRGTSLT